MSSKILTTIAAYHNQRFFAAKIANMRKRIYRERIAYILSNPFYYGHFRYGGEVFQGNHQPLISKKLWDAVQEVLQSRGKPKK